MTSLLLEVAVFTMGGVRGSVFRSTVSEVIPLSKYWLVDVDRDFETGRYGTGTRLFHNLEKNDLGYVTIVNKTRDETDESVTITASNGNRYKLVQEPDIDSWKSSVYAAWKTWDSKINWDEMENRSDYEPWAFMTRAALCGCIPAGASFYRDVPWSQ